MRPATKNVPVILVKTAVGRWRLLGVPCGSAEPVGERIAESRAFPEPSAGSCPTVAAR